MLNISIFWDIKPPSPYATRRFGGTYHLYLKVPSHLHAGFLLGLFSALKMEVISSSEMSVHILITR
jgi:hypothetical protein